MKDEPVRSRVVVFGSLNMDLVVRVPRMPLPGETLAGRSFCTYAGGKGANQAVACARQGTPVEMVGRVGDDVFGQDLCVELVRQTVAIDGVKKVAGERTGVAIIYVDDSAQNCIAIVPGANGQVGIGDAEALRSRLRDAGMLLLQLEVPIDAVLRAAVVAREAACKVLLNLTPVPAHPIPDALWPLLDILVVNESEAGTLTGLASVTRDNASEAALLLRQRGPDDVLVTLGEHGVVWSSAQGAQHFQAFPVQPVDTTAAGDTFVGALAAMLVAERGMPEAIQYAMRAAAICVTRPGAQASIPSRQEVEAFVFVD